LIDVGTARSFLRTVVPEWEWLVAQIESEGGRLRFPQQIADIIRNLKIESYPLLYENEASIGVVLAHGFMGRDELIGLERQLTAASPEGRGEMMRDFLRTLDEFGESFTIAKTPAEEHRAKEAFDALSPEEQAASIKLWQHLMMGFLATFFQHLSMMVHGEKLTALVAQAKAGDTTAFAKAIQIDKRILTAIPYFKERFAEAGLRAETDFLQEVGRRMSGPPYKGKIRHKSLWLTFATLQALGLLSSFKHEVLLDFCDEVGVGGHKSRIEDVKNLSKRLAEYRRFQERGIVSTP
jgi:hypothetical protein